LIFDKLTNLFCGQLIGQQNVRCLRGGGDAVKVHCCVGITYKQYKLLVEHQRWSR